MSQVLIQEYVNQLQDLRKVSGTAREGVVSEAFEDLLKGWSRLHNLLRVTTVSGKAAAITQAMKMAAR